MKKSLSFIFIVILFLSSFALFSCEGAAFLKCATISDVTATNSDDYAIKISFFQDKRLEDKYVDIQVKSNKVADIVVWEENKDKVTISLDDYDEWFSLTSLICYGEGKEGQEQFDKFSESYQKTYLFNYDGKLNLTFRVVVGDVEDNINGTGEILLGSEVISKQFTLNIK